MKDNIEITLLLKVPINTFPQTNKQTPSRHARLRGGEEKDGSERRLSPLCLRRDRTHQRLQGLSGGQESGGETVSTPPPQGPAAAQLLLQELGTTTNICRYAVFIRFPLTSSSSHRLLRPTEAEQSAVRRPELRHRLHGSRRSLSESDERELLPSVLPQDQL